MIKKTSILFICLFGLWTIYLTFINKDLEYTQHQWQGNIVKAQKFIYNSKENISSVIVGSSISGAIEDIHTMGGYNLSFAGQSATDGINILLKEDLGNIKTVFIETNVLSKSGDDDFLQYLYSPISYSLKKNIPSLKDNKQFLSILVNNIGKNSAEIYSIFRDKLEMILKGEVSNLKTNKTTDTVGYKAILEIDESVDTIGYKTMPEIGIDLYNKLIENQYKHYSKPYTVKEISLLKKDFEQLKKLVTTLEKKGVKIVFFEVPVNNSLVMTPRQSFQRNMVKEFFPTSQYSYIELPHNYTTYFSSDGIHLTISEKKRYTRYFKKEVNKLQRHN